MKKILIFVLSLALFVFLPLNQVSATIPAPPKNIEYQLPYPGILPDNPIYLLKRLRDAILDKLIVDPVRRIEFFVLQADKSLGMGLLLTEQKKVKAAEDVIMKGEVYLEQAANNLTDLKKKTEAPQYVVEKITLASQKHAQIINELILKADDAQKMSLGKALEKTKSVMETVSKLK